MPTCMPFVPAIPAAEYRVQGTSRAHTTCLDRGPWPGRYVLCPECPHSPRWAPAIWLGWLPSSGKCTVAVCQRCGYINGPFMNCAAGVPVPRLHCVSVVDGLSVGALPFLLGMSEHASGACSHSAGSRHSGSGWRDSVRMAVRMAAGTRYPGIRICMRFRGRKRSRASTRPTYVGLTTCTAVRTCSRKR